MGVPKPPTCPFCGRIIAKPTYLPIGFSDLEAGICECGSVYVCDVTGFNRGNAFVEALLIACAGDWNLAWELEIDVDYKEAWIENYDLSSHSVFPFPHPEKRRLGVLCFIKLADEIRELKSSQLREILTKKSSIEEIPKVEKRKLSKKEIEKLINEDNISLLIAYHVAEPLNFNIFQRLLYHPDIIFRKKVAVALGKVTEKVVNIHPERVLELIKRLIYASADSAASAWGALEAVGEILRNTGDRYSHFINNLLAFMEYPDFRLCTLYALYRIAEKNPQIFKKYSYLSLLRYLENSPPEVQGLILKIFSVLKAKEIIPYVEKIDLNQSFDLFNYETFEFEKITLRKIAESMKRGF